MNWHKQLTRGQWRTETTPAWNSAVGAGFVDTIMDWDVSDDFHAKQGRSTGRLVLNQDDLVVYLKRHWQLSWWNRLLACLFPAGKWTPAMLEWQNLQLAQREGFAVPEPLAVGQCIGPGLRLQSFLVIRELTGMLPLHQAIPLALSIMPETVFTRWKQHLLAQVADIARRLHARCFFHKDLYLCHFYVDQPQATDHLPGPLKLIDLHRFGYHRLTAWRWQIKDMAQLLFSTLGVAGLDNRDREWILEAYRGNARPTVYDDWLAAAVRSKARRYARHNSIEDIASNEYQGKAA